MGAIYVPEQSIIRISDYTTANDGVADATAGVNSAIAKAVSSGIYLVDTGGVSDTWLVTSFANTDGVRFVGSGQVVTSEANGLRQYNTYTDNWQPVVGLEYLSHFHKRLMAGTASSIVFSGDSTTNGNGATTPYRIWELVPALATKYGLTGITGVNAGHSGAKSSEWITTGLDYVSTDLAGNPDVYIVRWGLNDPQIPLTASQTIANIRSGLATCRASKTLVDMSIVLMMPNTTNDLTASVSEIFLEQLYHGFRQAARDYQCAFIDTYGMFRDGWNATDYMDTNANGEHLHPANVMNAWISSLIGDVLFPTALRSAG